MAATDRTTATDELNSRKFGLCPCSPAEEAWTRKGTTAREHVTEVEYQCQTCGSTDTAVFERVMA